MASKRTFRGAVKYLTTPTVVVTTPRAAVVAAQDKPVAPAPSLVETIQRANPELAPRPIPAPTPGSSDDAMTRAIKEQVTRRGNR